MEKEVYCCYYVILIFFCDSDDFDDVRIIIIEVYSIFFLFILVFGFLIIKIEKL